MKKEKMKEHMLEKRMQASSKGMEIKRIELMSDTKKSSITDKEYREIYNNMSKERLIELLIADKRELRRLRGMWLEQKQANEANKQPDTEALRLQNVNPRLLFDKGLEEQLNIPVVRSPLPTDEYIEKFAEERYPEYPDLSTEYGNTLDFNYEEKQDYFYQGAIWMRNKLGNDS